LVKGHDGYGGILLCYSSGVIGMLQANWITPLRIRTISLTGARGYAELDYIAQKLKFYYSNHEIDMDISPQESLERELQSFLGSIRKNEKLVVDGEIGLMALKNVYKVKRAIGKKWC